MRRLLDEGGCSRPFPPNGRDRRTKFLFPIGWNVNKQTDPITILKTFCRGAAESGSNRDYFVCDGIQFAGGSRDCDFAHAQRGWRKGRRGVLQRFRDLLPHLGFKQRAIWVPGFVSDD